MVLNAWLQKLGDLALAPQSDVAGAAISLSLPEADDSDPLALLRIQIDGAELGVHAGRCG
jgi:hypothetical protein